MGGLQAAIGCRLRVASVLSALLVLPGCIARYVLSEPGDREQAQALMHAVDQLERLDECLVDAPDNRAWAACAAAADRGLSRFASLASLRSELQSSLQAPRSNEERLDRIAALKQRRRDWRVSGFTVPAHRLEDGQRGRQVNLHLPSVAEGRLVAAPGGPPGGVLQLRRGGGLTIAGLSTLACSASMAATGVGLTQYGRYQDQAYYFVFSGLCGAASIGLLIGANFVNSHEEKKARTLPRWRPPPGAAP